MPVFHIEFDILGESIKNKHSSIIIEEVSNSEAPQYIHSLVMDIIILKKEIVIQMKLGKK